MIVYSVWQAVAIILLLVALFIYLTVKGALKLLDWLADKVTEALR